MNVDGRVRKLAGLLVNYSTRVKPGDKVLISGTVAAAPLLKEVYREVLKAGGHPHMDLELEDQQYIFFSNASKQQLEYEDPLLLQKVETLDVMIKTFPDTNPHALSSIDAEKKRVVAQARRKAMDLFTKRWGDGSLRWVGTACPTRALAQEARMSMEEYENFVYACGGMDLDDPVEYWKDFSKRQEKICKRLNQVKLLRYKGLDTDITFGVEKRPWINCDGKVNFPDGEVFTSPIEDQVNGRIRFTFPGIFQGQEIEDIFLEFRDGKVVKAKAAKGESLLNTLLDTDEGSRILGEVAIGTNDNIDKFTKNMLFDEKIGGTVHCAVGRGFPESKSNNSSAIHWDMLKDMKDGGEIYGDGELIYKNGKFTEDFLQ
ncbi:MAG: aminopeptidase [Deltaproteobacteria bacterium]|nr:aminopeptidase [Deltaproteobacteria bacterium]